MPQLKPVYLIHGDDHGAVAQRRAGLRALAEGLGEGTIAVEVLEGERATPALLAAALATMTLSGSGGEPGGLERVILVEGVERWREADVDEELATALAPMQSAGPAARRQALEDTLWAIFNSKEFLFRH